MVLRKWRAVYMNLTPESGALAVLVIRGMSLIGLSLRLRWQQRHEESKGQMVVTMMSSLPPGWAIEEQFADGSRLKISQRPDRAGECCNERA
jgi:hypothetical protein